MLVNTSAEGDLLADIRADRAGQDQLGSIVLDSSNLGTGRCGTNVNHDDFVLGQLGDLGLLAIGGLDTEQTSEEVEVDFDFAVDIGELALKTQDETDQTIGTAKGRIDLGTDTDQTTGNSVLEVVAF